jgi:hypothetical protein
MTEVEPTFITSTEVGDIYVDRGQRSALNSRETPVV